MSQQISQQTAHKAINVLMQGEPPGLEILELVTVGLDRDLKTFEREYFRPTSFIASDETSGSTFKIVEAYYGGGKTHYMRAVERTAHRHGFASAFVGLKKEECPLTRFDLVYHAVAESLTVPQNDSSVHGFSAVIRSWCDRLTAGQDDAFQAIRQSIDGVGDIPLMSMKIALRHAAQAHVSGDQESFEQALVYLSSGKITPGLRKLGILESIDQKNGSKALRSLASLVKRMGNAGFVLILDEGDRSLSLSSNKEKSAASNNLVQLINEAATEGAWPSTILIYSIPSWASFQDAFGHNQALIGRVESTGFPLIPPATRIVLDDRESNIDEKKAFCSQLAERLSDLFRTAYPGDLSPDAPTQKAADLVAHHVTKLQMESTYRRLFVQSYLAALYVVVDSGRLTSKEAETIVKREAHQLSKEGN